MGSACMSKPILGELDHANAVSVTQAQPKTSTTRLRSHRPSIVKLLLEKSTETELLFMGLTPHEVITLVDSWDGIPNHKHLCNTVFCRIFYEEPHIKRSFHVEMIEDGEIHLHRHFSIHLNNFTRFLDKAVNMLACMSPETDHLILQEASKVAGIHARIASFDKNVASAEIWELFVRTIAQQVQAWHLDYGWRHRFDVEDNKTYLENLWLIFLHRLTLDIKRWIRQQNNDARSDTESVATMASGIGGMGLDGANGQFHTNLPGQLYRNAS